MYKLIDNPKTNSLAEVFQSNNMKFAFANYTDKEDSLQLIMPWVQCREYFNELLMQNHHPDEFKFQITYGFNYNYKKFPLNKDELILAIKFPNDKFKNQFLDNLSYIHKIEELNKLDELTAVTETTEPLQLVIKASKFWQQRCLLLNVYTLLIKLCSLNYPQTELPNLKSFNNLPMEPSEVSYINTISVKTFKNLLPNLTLVAELPTKYVDGHDEMRHCGTVHADSGIVHMFIQCHNKFMQDLKDLISKNTVPV